MADEERQETALSTEEEQGKELQRSTWLPEHAEVIDDVIDELSSVAPNKRAIRELTTRSPLYPSGEGLESDVGYVQCKPPRVQIVQIVHEMMKVTTQFRGIIYRDKAALVTVLVGFGLTRLESMLIRRAERIRKEWEDYKARKTHYTIKDYQWKYFTPVEKGSKWYVYNFYLLDSTLGGRINVIKREYDLSRSFTVQMSIIEAIRTSRLWPGWLTELADKEHEEFRDWVAVKTLLDTTNLPNALPSGKP